MLNSYVSYQLFKRSFEMNENIIIHSYNFKETFEFWEINFIEKLIQINGKKMNMINKIEMNIYDKQFSHFTYILIDIFDKYHSSYNIMLNSLFLLHQLSIFL